MRRRARNRSRGNPVRRSSRAPFPTRRERPDAGSAAHRLTRSHRDERQPRGGKRSPRATLPGARLPGFTMTKRTPSSRAACTRSTSAPSWLLWNADTRTPRRAASSTRRASTSARVSVPQRAGSAVPRRFRLGPCNTSTEPVAPLRCAGAWAAPCRGRSHRLASGSLHNLRSLPELAGSCPDFGNGSAWDRGAASHFVPQDRRAGGAAVRRGDSGSQRPAAGRIADCTTNRVQLPWS